MEHLFHQKIFDFVELNLRMMSFFLDLAKHDVEFLIKNMGLNRNSKVLDIGCASGRLAIGMNEKIGLIDKYIGMDVSYPHVKWAKKNITKKNPYYDFIHINIKNSRYNPKGNILNSKFRFPFENNSFDKICLFSVLIHMTLIDVKIYLKEVNRLLENNGKVFMTVFTKKIVLK